jgi:hypothetical protein
MKSNFSLRDRPPRGASSLEVIVAFTLVSAILAMATPLVIAQGKLLMRQRDYRLALSELTSQLAQLSALPPDQVRGQLAALKPSEFASEQLPEAEITGKLEPSELGERVTLELTWSEPHRAASPVILTGWLRPSAGTGTTSDTNPSEEPSR